MAKLLKEKYKTAEGAYKRARFENGLARGEFLRGDKARIYHYRAIPDDYHPGIYRVERTVSASDPAIKASC